MLLGLNEEHNFLLNIIILISKFALWKIRNKEKYEKLTFWMNYLECEIRLVVEVKCNRTVDKENSMIFLIT